MAIDLPRLDLRDALDLATAPRSTGVTDVATYMVAPRGLRAASRLLPLLAPTLAIPGARTLAAWALSRGVPGPTEEERRRGTSRLYAEAEGPGGVRAAARLRTPDAYALTADAIVHLAERVLAGELVPGW